MFLPSGFLLLVFMWTSSASSRTRFMYSSKPCERIHWFKCALDRNGGFWLLCFSLCFNNNKCGIYHHFDSETSQWSILQCKVNEKKTVIEYSMKNTHKYIKKDNLVQAKWWILHFKCACVSDLMMVDTDTGFQSFRHSNNPFVPGPRDLLAWSIYWLLYSHSTKLSLLRQFHGKSTGCSKGNVKVEFSNFWH